MARDLVRWVHTVLLPAAAEEPADRAEWQPSVDVYRTASGWLVKFDLAGVRPEDIELRVAGCRLNVRGSRRDWSVTEGCRSYHMEIAYSRFERTVELPGPCGEVGRVTTEFRDGMLLVRVPSVEEAAQP